MSRSAVPILDSLWRASEMGTPASFTTPSGHPGLDAELPGGGWPAGQLSEVLQAQAGLHEWRLLLPAVRAASASGVVVLIGCPHWPNMAALAGQGIGLSRVLLVDAAKPAERLWAAEQALRCRDLAALMVWLPQARPEQLRRLQFSGQAAHQPRPPLAFVFRPLAAQQDSSPAPLRLALRQSASAAGALPSLEVDIFKRRGPLMAAPLRIHTAVPPVLALRGNPSAPRPVPEPVVTPATSVRTTDNVVTLPTARLANVLLDPLPTANPDVVDCTRPTLASA